MFPEDPYGDPQLPEDPYGDPALPEDPYGYPALPNEYDGYPPLPGDPYGYPPLPEEYDDYGEDDAYMLLPEEDDDYMGPSEFQILQVAGGGTTPSVPASTSDPFPVDGLDQARLVYNPNAYCTFSGQRVRDCTCKKHRAKG